MENDIKKITDRGRTFDQVANPKKYHPFSGISDKDSFEIAWNDKPDWIFANMSHAAYHDCEYLEPLFAKFGAKIKFYESDFDENGKKRGREAFLAIWDDKAILSFRGTEADDKIKIKVDKTIISVFKSFGVDLPTEMETLFPTDLFDDFAFASKSVGKSSVHGGFLKATEELWPEISNDLSKIKISNPDQVFVTGHSLGAAMAVIAGMKYSFKEIVTFGEPSVGNDLDKTIKRDSHIRYVNGDDPVTKIVPESLFKHHGKLTEIEDIGGSDCRFDHSIISYSVILGPSIVR